MSPSPRKAATKTGTRDGGSRRCIFFFQAEDGIRDVAVTGVQTCALPIYAGNALDHLRRIPRVLLPEQLEDAPRVLQGEVVGHIFRQMRRRGGLAIGAR